ncbi:helix-turn-helix transcriptional regulator [Aeromonas allosaccharophila]|uniref:helix-turn-helix transcriptional regulator n=1 Tax=Aeromonas allosaccharophila TaxID=656 RepID=UPI003986B8FD
MNHQSARFIRMQDVKKMIGVSRSTVYDWINPKSPRFDNSFPKPVRLGINSIAWVDSELEDWLAKRIAARTGC